MRSGTPLRRTAAVVVLVVGAIHGFLAPEYFGEQFYLGVLFVAAAVASAFAAVRLWFVGGRLAWAVGGAVSVGAFVGFILSRTTGLPGFHERSWELIGIISLVAEALFLVLFAVRERRALARGATKVQEAITPGGDGSVATASRR